MLELTSTSSSSTIAQSPALTDAGGDHAGVQLRRLWLIRLRVVRPRAYLSDHPAARAGHV
jgi:hypothetical protein